MVNFRAAMILVCVAGTWQSAWAHSLRQKLGVYRDSEGMTRRRTALEGAIEGPATEGRLSGSNLNLQVSRDRYRDRKVTEDESEYNEEVYGSNIRVQDMVSLTTSQTWNRVGQTRQVMTYQSDGEVTARTYGIGMSQWILHETLRLGLDFSRTILEQPLFEILGYDSEILAPPRVSSSTGVTASLRHLATPTTMIDYQAGYVNNQNRPETKTFLVGVRQYIPALAGALHWKTARSLNRGRITTRTTYGSVDAWIHEAAVLKKLWSGARLRTAYRYYKENETTRAYGDEKVFGSDTVSAGLSQDLPKDATALDAPLTVAGTGARYLTNTGVSATSVEASMTARF